MGQMDPVIQEADLAGRSIAIRRTKSSLGGHDNAAAEVPYSSPAIFSVLLLLGLDDLSDPFGSPVFNAGSRVRASAGASARAHLEKL